ncbi:MAG: hypothetical protein AAFR96_07695 [Planctomycetota bacterium]
MPSGAESESGVVDGNANPTLETGAVGRVYASVAGLAGFVVAILSGINAENAASSILADAIVCMIACYLVGTALGALAQHAVAAHLVRMKREQPIPEAAPMIVAEEARS